MPSQIPIETLRRATDQFRALISERLPLHFDHGEVWPVIATGFVARVGVLLESWMRLLEAKRAADSQILLRVLYEHVTVFCWLAIDPANNVKEWREWEDCRNLKLHNDALKYGVKDVLTAEELVAIGKPKEPRSMPELAMEVDQYWPNRSRAFRGHPENGLRHILTFSGFYTALYRRSSRLIHAAGGGIERHMTQPLTGHITVHSEEKGTVDPPDTPGLAIPLMAFLLVAYAHHFEWPDEEIVKGINDSVMYEADS